MNVKNTFFSTTRRNTLSLAKQMATDYKNILDWDSTPALQTTFTQSFVYDAMNRPMQLTKPDGTIEEYTYNKAALLETIKAKIRGAATFTNFVTNINYNEKGQRTEIFYGNGTKTKYTYDPLTFRLTELFTTRNGGSDELQKISYTYDPVGNITQVNDGAQQTHYFNNTATTASGVYTYDALYRLKTATGRELTSLQLPSNTDFVNNIAVPNTSANAMQNYTQEFDYDELGNINQMKSVGNWTRDYFYNNNNNYLLGHTNGNTEYNYDKHGNITAMPHLTSMLWDYKDELKEVTLNASGDKAYYVYDTSGERVRKVVEKTGGIIEERIYLGGCEIYRKTVSGVLDFERETLHISDNTKKIASIETKTVENGSTISSPVSNIRYQYDNHLGSASLELDENAAIISYEEYHPFGTTSYRSGRTETEVSLKRYKYVGKEGDEETGLYYYGARYYASWIARFVSVDPLQVKYPHYTPYQYAGNKPISYIDLDGLEEIKPKSFSNNTDIVELQNKETDDNQTEKVLNLIGEIPGMVILVDKKTGASFIRENSVTLDRKEDNNYAKATITTTSYTITDQGVIDMVYSETTEWNIFQNNEGEFFTDALSDGKTIFGDVKSKFLKTGEQADNFIESESKKNNTSAKIVKAWSELTKNRMDILTSGNAPYKVSVFETMKDALMGNIITSESFLEIPNKMKEIIDGLSGFGNLPSINKAHTHRIPIKEMKNAEKAIKNSSNKAILWKAN